MNRRQKQTLSAGIIALLGIVLIIGVIWHVSRTRTFRNYHNKAHGFSISYPANWSLQENKGGAAVIFFSPQENDLDFFKESVNVVVQDLSLKPMDLQEYTDLAIKQMELVFEENFIIVESKPTFVAGQTGHKLIFIGKGPDTELKYMCVWLIKDLTAYQITYTALSTQYDRYIGKMKKMVKSFSLD